MKKVTAKNYEDAIWCDVEDKEEVKYSNHFRFCDVSWHAQRFGVDVIPSYAANTVKVVAMTRRCNIKSGYIFNPAIF